MKSLAKSDIFWKTYNINKKKLLIFYKEFIDETFSKFRNILKILIKQNL